MFHPALATIPPPAERRIAIRITPNAERAIRGGHPWLFDQAITHQNHAGKPGDLAVLFDQQRKFLGIGFYDPHTPIRVRVLQHRQQASIDTGWFQQRIQTAAKIRQQFPNHTTGYRLAHGENDGLPGLIIDRYESNYVLKVYSKAWIPHIYLLLPVLQNVVSTNRLVFRMSRQVQSRYGSINNLEEGQILHGSALDGPVKFLENGLIFEVGQPKHLADKIDLALSKAQSKMMVEAKKSVKDFSWNKLITKLESLF